ncbi:MAG: exosortase/archaeosortase family protein [Verrucomicrobiota bacterium]
MSKESSDSLRILILPCLMLLAFAWQMHGFWNPDSHYFYGWGVPVLSLYLIWEASAKGLKRGAPQIPWLFIALAFGLGYSVIRLVWDTMSTWLMLSWIQGFLLVAFALSWLIAWGGIKWAKHFALPFAMMLTAIPWPGSIERALSDWLTDKIAHFVTLSLQLLGIPALLQGIEISIGSAVIEVAEACSGIRSLQFLVVSSIFLGEFGSLSVPRRIILVIIGLVASFVQNAIRALFLGWVTGIEGQEAYDRWHDNAGGITFVLGLSVVLIGFIILEKKKPDEKPDNPVEPAGPLPGLCTTITILLIGFLAALEAFHAYWYRLPDAIEDYRWSLQHENVRDLPIHRVIEVDDLTKEILETEDVYSGQYLWNGNSVNYHVVEWPDGHPVMRANAHNPEVCIKQVNGLRQIGQRETFIMEDPNGGELEMEVYEFEDPIRYKRITVFRSMLLPTSTQDYYQFYTRAQASWGDKWKLVWENFWKRVDEDSLITRQMVLIGVTQPGGQNQPFSVEDFITESLSRETL